MWGADLLRNPRTVTKFFFPLTLALQRHERCGLGWERVHLRQARRLFSPVRLAAHKLFRDGCRGAFSASVSWRVQDLAIPRRWNLNLPLRFQESPRSHWHPVIWRRRSGRLGVWHHDPLWSTHKSPRITLLFESAFRQALTLRAAWDPRYPLLYKSIKREDVFLQLFCYQKCQKYSHSVLKRKYEYLCKKIFW